MKHILDSHGFVYTVFIQSEFWFAYPTSILRLMVSTVFLEFYPVFWGNSNTSLPCNCTRQPIVRVWAHHWGDIRTNRIKNILNRLILFGQALYTSVLIYVYNKWTMISCDTLIPTSICIEILRHQVSAKFGLMDYIQSKGPRAAQLPRQLCLSRDRYLPVPASITVQNVLNGLGIGPTAGAHQGRLPQALSGI